MLHLTGLGLAPGDITRNGMEALKGSDRAYVEFYTNTPVELSELREQTSTSIEELFREEVEQDLEPVERAEGSEISFLVPGDPLTATTHLQLLRAAKERGIEVRVHRSASVMTAVAETGLSLYKFGRTVTLPEESTPESVVSGIRQNMEAGMHTLVLLDIGLGASSAARRLDEALQEHSEMQCVVASRLGKVSQEIHVTSLERAADRSYGEPPHAILLPGETSHNEEKFMGMHR